MRRTSVSLPTSKAPAHDPHEKSNRYSSSRSAKNSAVGTLEKVQNAWMTQSARSRYLKTGGILFFVIFLFYILVPAGESRYSGGGSSGIIKPSGGQTPSDSSYGTSKCTKSSDKSKPIIQYVLMIDAGSTGSRIHVYRFNNCGSTPELESEDFMMNDIKVGGLSRYDDDPEAAAKTLDPLLEMAMKKVPDALKGCSPVAVKATAGLRKSGQAKSEKILQAVRTRLETAYPFPVVSAAEGGVEVMEGKDEGVYAWITTNYLLGKIGGPDHSPTAAVFDLGGGSTQVVFEPTFQASKNGGMPEHMAEGDHKYKLSFGGREFELYQHSHLGFGLMEARNTMHKTLIDDILSQHKDDATNAWLKKPIVNPCIAPGMTKAVNVTMGADHKLGNKILVDMAGPSSPAPALCRGLAEKILVKDKECKLAPCSFNGIHQPSLEKTFAREDIYAFSYFYDRTQPLGMPESFTLRELQHLTEQVCGGEKAWDVFTNVPDAIEKELKERPEQCLDLNFMMALLHTGYEMPIDREIKIAKKIKGNELGWCLGASLPLLSQGSGWKCKVKQIQ